MFIPAKKLVFQIFILLQTAFAYFYIDDKLSSINKRKESEFELERIFGYNFYYITQLNGVLVWKISMGQQTFIPEDYSMGFIEFGTNEAYLILAQNYEFTLFYWVGMETTLEHKKHAAKYAALLFVVLKEYDWLSGHRFNFAREDEIFESESFIHSLNLLRSTDEPKDEHHKVHRDNNVPLNGLNLYLVKDGQDRSSLKVPVGVGLQLLTMEMCLVVDVLPSHITELHPASAYCSDGVKDEVRWRAQTLVGNIRNSYFVPETVVRGSDKYKTLVELLEDKQYYRPSENPYLQNGHKFISDPHEGIILFKISIVNINETRTTIREAVETPVSNLNMDYYYNYILDSKSVAGIFFVYAEIDNANKILWTIQNAEEYLQDEITALGSPIRMRITAICGGVQDFKMNLAPRPLPDDVSWILRDMSGGYY